VPGAVGEDADEVRRSRCRRARGAQRGRCPSTGALIDSGSRRQAGRSQAGVASRRSRQTQVGRTPAGRRIRSTRTSQLVGVNDKGGLSLAI
jgi:hypothetical protein